MKRSLCMWTICLVLMLLAGVACAGTPGADCYMISDGNIQLDIPYGWQYGGGMEAGFYSGVMLNEDGRYAMVTMIPEDYAEPRNAEVSLAGFWEEGKAVMAGGETASSRVLERYTIDDLPAARVNMIGQGFEMIWVADEGDLYFIMYPVDDKDFAQQMREIGASLHVIDARTPVASDEADYAFVQGKEGATITAYIGEKTRVCVPDTLAGRPVVSISHGAFYETAVRHVEIPESVRELGEGCFSGCTELRTLVVGGGVDVLPDGALESCFHLHDLTLPETMTHIGTGVFWGNMCLENVRLPAALEEIGTNNFVMCPWLEQFIVDDDCPGVRAEDNGAVLLTRDGKRLICYAAWQERTAYTVPDGVETVDFEAFADTVLEEVTFPEGFRVLGGGAFSRAMSLKRVTFPSTIEVIGLVEGLTVSSLETGERKDVASATIPISSVDPVIVGYPGTPAQTYAEENNLDFELLPGGGESGQ